MLRVRVRVRVRVMLRLRLRVSMRVRARATVSGRVWSAISSFGLNKCSVAGRKNLNLTRT